MSGCWPWTNRFLGDIIEEVAQLRIEIDEVKKARQVAEITESEYFQRLQEHAEEMRKKAKGE